MYYFIAESDSELGCCLRMLFSEGLAQPDIRMERRSNGQVLFHIGVNIAQKQFDVLNAQFLSLRESCGEAEDD